MPDEAGSTVENPQVLTHAVSEVSKLSNKPRIPITPNQEQSRDRAWAKTAEQFPEFRERIIDLGKALLDGWKTQKNFFPDDKANSVFSVVTDQKARDVLTAILWRRMMADQPGNIRGESHPEREEGEKMYQELGLTGVYWPPVDRDTINRIRVMGAFFEFR